MADVFRDKEKFINTNLKRFESDILKLQTELWDLIAMEYIPDFNITKGGNLARNNVNKAIALDKIFTQFDEEFQKSVLSRFANDLLKLTNFSKRQFAADGFKKATLDKISEQTGFINKSIGIDKKGNLIKGSYLDRLATTAEVRSKLKNYVVSQVNVKTNLKDFQKGFKDLVVGNKARGIKGELFKYHSQFSFDAFSQIGRVSDVFYGEQLGLGFFIYEGTLIKTSRCFCIKRKGMIFNIEDTRRWKNDSQLLGDPNTYNPLMELGRWRCRHQIRMISNELAEELGYSKKKANSILRKGCSKKKK